MTGRKDRWVNEWVDGYREEGRDGWEDKLGECIKNGLRRINVNLNTLANVYVSGNEPVNNKFLS